MRGGLQNPEPGGGLIALSKFLSLKVFPNSKLSKFWWGSLGLLLVVVVVVVVEVVVVIVVVVVLLSGLSVNVTGVSLVSMILFVAIDELRNVLTISFFDLFDRVEWVGLRLVETISGAKVIGTLLSLSFSVVFLIHGGRGLVVVRGLFVVDTIQSKSILIWECVFIKWHRRACSLSFRFRKQKKNVLWDILVSYFNLFFKDFFKFSLCLSRIRLNKTPWEPIKPIKPMKMFPLMQKFHLTGSP